MREPYFWQLGNKLENTFFELEFSLLNLVLRFQNCDKSIALKGGCLSKK